MDSSLLASWIGVSTGIIAIVITVFVTWISRRIKIQGNVSSPTIYIGEEDFPCQVELVNHGVRQAFISKVNIEISARNSWEVCVDLRLHEIDKLLLVDGEEFKKVLLLKKEMEKLRSDYNEESDFFDHFFPMKVVFGFETTKKQFVKIHIEKKLKNKIVNFVKNSNSSNLKPNC